MLPKKEKQLFTSETLALKIYTKMTHVQQKMIESQVNAITTKNRIKTKHIYTVQGYARNDKIKPIHQDVLNLILLYYAKPLAMNIEYKSKIKAILICPIELDWNSLEVNILKAYQLSQTRYRGTLQCLINFCENEKVQKSNWETFTWNENNIF
eukprot:425063_1